MCFRIDETREYVLPIYIDGSGSLGKVRFRGYGDDFVAFDSNACRKNVIRSDDFSALDPGLNRYVSQTYSKGYLRHLFVASEILGLQIASLQNLSFYLWLMESSRKAIREGNFLAWKTGLLPRVSRRL